MDDFFISDISGGWSTGIKKKQFYHQRSNDEEIINYLMNVD
jgi:hypothetical protein